MNIPYDRRGLHASPSNPERPRWVQASGTGLGWVQSPTVEGDRGYTSPYAVGPMVNQTTGNAVLRVKSLSEHGQSDALRSNSLSEHGQPELGSKSPYPAVNSPPSSLMSPGRAPGIAKLLDTYPRDSVRNDIDWRKQRGAVSEERQRVADAVPSNAERWTPMLRDSWYAAPTQQDTRDVSMESAEVSRRQGRPSWSTFDLSPSPSAVPAQSNAMATGSGYEHGGVYPDSVVTPVGRALLAGPSPYLAPGDIAIGHSASGGRVVGNSIQRSLVGSDSAQLLREVAQPQSATPSSGEARVDVGFRPMASSAREAIYLGTIPETSGSTDGASYVTGRERSMRAGGLDLRHLSMSGDHTSTPIARPPSPLAAWGAVGGSDGQAFPAEAKQMPPPPGYLPMGSSSESAVSRPARDDSARSTNTERVRGMVGSPSPILPTSPPATTAAVDAGKAGSSNGEPEWQMVRDGQGGSGPSSVGAGAQPVGDAGSDDGDMQSDEQHQGNGGSGREGKGSGQRDAPPEGRRDFTRPEGEAAGRVVCIVMNRRTRKVAMCPNRRSGLLGLPEMTFPLHEQLDPATVAGETMEIEMPLLSEVIRMCEGWNWAFLRGQVEGPVETIYAFHYTLAGAENPIDDHARWVSPQATLLTQVDQGSHEIFPRIVNECDRIERETASPPTSTENTVPVGTSVGGVAQGQTPPSGVAASPWPTMPQFGYTGGRDRTQERFPRAEPPPLPEEHLVAVLPSREGDADTYIMSQWRPNLPASMFGLFVTPATPMRAGPDSAEDARRAVEHSLGVNAASLPMWRVGKTRTFVDEGEGFYVNVSWYRLFIPKMMIDSGLVLNQQPDKYVDWRLISLNDIATGVARPWVGVTQLLNDPNFKAAEERHRRATVSSVPYNALGAAEVPLRGATQWESKEELVQRLRSMPLESWFFAWDPQREHDFGIRFLVDAAKEIPILVLHFISEIGRAMNVSAWEVATRAEHIIQHLLESCERGNGIISDITSREEVRAACQGFTDFAIAYARQRDLAKLYEPHQGEAPGVPRSSDWEKRMARRGTAILARQFQTDEAAIEIAAQRQAEAAAAQEEAVRRAMTAGGSDDYRVPPPLSNFVHAKPQQVDLDAAAALLPRFAERQPAMPHISPYSMPEDIAPDQQPITRANDFASAVTGGGNERGLLYMKQTLHPQKQVAEMPVYSSQLYDDVSQHVPRRFAPGTLVTSAGYNSQPYGHPSYESNAQNFFRPSGPYGVGSQPAGHLQTPELERGQLMYAGPAYAAGDTVGNAAGVAGFPQPPTAGTTYTQQVGAPNVYGGVPSGQANILGFGAAQGQPQIVGAGVQNAVMSSSGLPPAPVTGPGPIPYAQDQRINEWVEHIAKVSHIDSPYEMGMLDTGIRGLSAAVPMLARTFQTHFKENSAVPEKITLTANEEKLFRCPVDKTAPAMTRVSQFVEWHDRQDKWATQCFRKWGRYLFEVGRVVWQTFGPQYVRMTPLQQDQLQYAEWFPLLEQILPQGIPPKDIDAIRNYLMSVNRTKMAANYDLNESTFLPESRSFLRTPGVKQFLREADPFQYYAIVTAADCMPRDLLTEADLERAVPQTKRPIITTFEEYRLWWTFACYIRRTDQAGSFNDREVWRALLKVPTKMFELGKFHHSLKREWEDVVRQLQLSAFDGSWNHVLWIHSWILYFYKRTREVAPVFAQINGSLQSANVFATAHVAQAFSSDWEDEYGYSQADWADEVFEHAQAHAASLGRPVEEEFKQWIACAAEIGGGTRGLRSVVGKGRSMPGKGKGKGKGDGKKGKGDRGYTSSRRPSFRQQVRPGDKFCPKADCGAHNFASRDKCFKCGTALPQTTGAGGKGKGFVKGSGKGPSKGKGPPSPFAARPRDKGKGAKKGGPSVHFAGDSQDDVGWVPAGEYDEDDYEDYYSDLEDDDTPYPGVFVAQTYVSLDSQAYVVDGAEPISTIPPDAAPALVDPPSGPLDRELTDPDALAANIAKKAAADEKKRLANKARKERRGTSKANNAEQEGDAGRGDSEATSQKDTHESTAAGVGAGGSEAESVSGKGDAQNQNKP